MTHRERILAILHGRTPDRVPWFGDLDYLATSLIHKGEKTSDFKLTDAYIQWHRELGVGFYLQGSFPFKMIFENCRIKEYRDGDARIREVHTPEGVLREKWLWLKDSFTEGPVEHLVKSESDLPAYRSMYENLRYEPDNTFLEVRKSQIGQEGVLLAYLPKSPLMQMVALDAGIMTFMELFMNAGESLNAVLNTIRKSHDKAAAIAVNSDAEILMIPENLSSEVVGPNLFELYMKEYQEFWCRKIKESGKFSCIHMDGTLKGLLRQECKAGFSFIEAMTPSPVGDLPIEDWEQYAEDTIFWGGLPGCFLTDMISDEEFEAFMRKTLSVMITEPRYVLGIADQAPPDTNIKRLSQIGHFVEKYGRFD